MKKKCNICNKKFIDYLSLGNHPCADTFLKSKYKAKRLRKYPLVVGYCECSHMTSVFPVPSSERYEKYDYSYTSDNSVISRSHFKSIAKKICKLFKINKHNFIIEAGSNDGTFLNEIKKIAKPKLLGVDPSKNISYLAKKKKINTMVDYFNSKVAKKIITKYGFADVIYGANVFNHVDDNIDFLKASNILLKDSGVLILEVPDLNSLIDKVGFDTIYHEHRHYYSQRSIYKVLAKESFEIIKIDNIKYMAGSIRVYAKKTKSNSKFSINYKKLSYVNHRQFKKFKKNIHIVINEIQNFINYNLEKQRIIYGIGAATKGNTLLNCCKLDDKKIKYILEMSKYKINKFTPGSAIKIISEKKVKNIKAILILPWNITSHLLNKFSSRQKILYTSIQKVVRKIK